LGCGGSGGNITSDNISPRHLLNIKRVAYELRPAVRTAVQPLSASKIPYVAAPEPQLPRAPGVVGPAGLDAASMARQVESLFVGSRAGTTSPANTDQAAVVDFVCEEDVRQALRLTRKIVIGDRTIITPAARDLGDAHRVFVMANWPKG
jgi:hypothetical protein